MRGVNKVILVGNVGKDPEVRYTQGGTGIATFSIATSEQWKDKQSGEQKEKTEWHRIKVFGALAEVVGEYVRKGTQLYCEGKIRTEEYEKDGIKRFTTYVIMDQMNLLGSRPETGERQERPQPQQRRPAPASTGPGDFDDDEIPF